MQITVNGNVIDLPAGTTANVLVEKLELTGKRIAMEVNEEIVPRSTYDSHCFRDGDKVEIVQAIGGG